MLLFIKFCLGLIAFSVMIIFALALFVMFVMILGNIEENKLIKDNLNEN